MNCDKIGNCDQCPRWFDEGKDFCKCCGFDLNSYNQPEEEEEECICESDKKPNPLCPDHQCCWACSTQSVPITLNEEQRLWLCDECNDLGDWCRGCHKLIDEDGYCSFGCDYHMYEGSWKCNGCDTWREGEKYCADCGPDPLDVEADEEDKREREKESFEEYYERRKDCRCNAWACDACQYRLGLEDRNP